MTEVQKRKCSGCGDRKDISEFAFRSKALGKLQKYCKSCGKKYRKTHYLANRRHYIEKAAEYKKKHSVRHSIMSHGLQSQDAEVRKALGSTVTCEICGVKPEGRLSIDHDHATGKFRGLLCHSCNLGIGWLKDNEAVLLAAAEYLRKHREG
jgi:hypothetical protein